MSQDSCSYDCAAPPTSISPYSDITGIGVIIGYMGTAGIVVLIIAVYYLRSYDPNKDPFRDDESSSGTSIPAFFRPNPVDVFVLQLTSNRFSNSPVRRRSSRLEAAMIKCVLAMSDLQILTGLSILISGYAQLRCGLSCYHWQLLIYLAWFSSLTHQACLTFLRHYLHSRSVERTWRLVAMGTLVVMLVVATIPSANYNWNSSLLNEGLDVFQSAPAPADYAICYFKPRGPLDATTLTSVIISVLLISLGFVSRVLRLHQFVAMNIISKARRAASDKVRKQLRRNYAWCDIENYPTSLKRHFIYRPLLAVFLVMRLILDIWSSMFFELWWLVVGFIWGVLKFMSTFLLHPRGNDDWTFGQVVPVVLLAAPLLAILEYLASAEDDTLANASQSSSSPTSPSTPTSGLIPNTHNSMSTSVIPSSISTSVSIGSGNDSILHTQSHTISSTASPPRTPAPNPNHSPSRVQTIQLATAAYTIPPDLVKDDPDCDFFRDSVWYKKFTFFGILSIGVLSGYYTIVLAAFDSEKIVQILVPSAYIWKWPPVAFLYAAGMMVLNCFLAETFALAPGVNRRLPLWVLSRKRAIATFEEDAVLFCLALQQALPPEGSMIQLWLLSLVPAGYIVGCIFYNLLG